MKRDALPFEVPLAPALPTRPGWRAALPALVVTLLLIGVGYLETGTAIVGTWYRSATYAHGFVVVPISLWLVWRKREALRAAEPHPWLLPLPFLAVAGFAWLLGEFGAVNAMSQGALVAMLVLSVPALLGREVARILIFPMAFLAFAVPIGDFLLPTLMDRTADFTIWALRLSGVPVYREGLLLVIPTGRWSIVEACSGVRYLIASLMVGTLFAYLNYHANWRRCVFIGISAVVPIIANWIRAYLIVLIGHLSNNKLAVGVDHLIYGWLFFGVVMLLMFWIGSWWREPPAPVSVRAGTGALARGDATSAVRFWAVSIAVLGVTLLWPLANVFAESSSDSALALDVGDLPGWQAAADGTGFTPRFESPSASIQQSRRRGGAVAGLYIAYYRHQNSQHKLVSSENVLIRSDDTAWRRTGDTDRRVRLGDVEYKVLETRMRRPDGRTFVAWHWYWIDGTVTASDIAAKAGIAWSRLVRRRDDAAAIIVYAEDGDGRNAIDTLQQFTRDAWPAIDGALMRARSGG